MFLPHAAGEVEGGTLSHKACTDKDIHKHRCHGMQPNFVSLIATACAPAVSAARRVEYNKNDGRANDSSARSVETRSLRSERKLLSSEWRQRSSSRAGDVHASGSGKVDPEELDASRTLAGRLCAPICH